MAARPKLSAAPPGEREAITWDIAVPLVTNPVMLRAMAVVGLGSGALLGLLVGLLLLVQGDGLLALQMLGYALAGGSLLFGFSLVIMLLVFGNKFHTRFMVSKDGVRCQTQDRRALASNRAALVLGLLTGRPGAAGSGLLAITQEDQSLHWTGAFTVRANAARRTITMRNRWRTLLTVYCTAGNFDAVWARVSEQMAMHGTAARADGRSPLGGYLLRTGLAVLASLPVLLAGDLFGYGLLLPFLLMCFAIATVWFVRHLAWVVVGLVALQGAALLVGALAARPSAWRAGASYLRYETLSGDAWALTALAAAGLVYLAGFAVQTLRQRIRPALESDLHDGQGS